ncbi:MAG: NUDIX hydrolase [Streptococcaceae bacterium]|jgi:ADP-ribose pyrophosphatase YjhB (NUDIX family)|nr:NUDIX hydrolase [Streptococcaceae bacterium]
MFNSKAEERRYYEEEASEAAYLAWYQTQEVQSYARPSLTIDNIIFSFDRERERLQILLIQRMKNPERGKYAFPGGFVNPNEDAKQAAIRETKEEVGILVADTNIWQVGLFSKPKRDPRTWVVSVAHVTYLPPSDPKKVQAGDDAKSAEWLDIVREGATLYLVDASGTKIGLDALAFDHQEMFMTSYNRIKQYLEIEPDIVQVLGEEFTINEVLAIFKIFDDRFDKMDNSNFKKTFIQRHKIFQIISGVDFKPKLRSTGVGRPKLLIRYLKKY